MSSKLAYNINEAVEATGIKRTRLYEEIKAGNVKTRKHGHRTVILAEDLNAFLASLPPAEAA